MKTDREPTLIEQLYRRSFRREVYADVVSPGQIFKARKFTLDPSMSTYLADLGNQIFSKRGKDLSLVEALRVSARLPHPSTWVEFDMQLRLTRLVEVYGRQHIDPKASVERFGWLLEQHPRQETAFRCINATGPGKAFDAPVDMPAFFQPWGFMWTVDNSPLPWPHLKVETPLAIYEDSGDSRRMSVPETATGVMGYNTPYAGICRVGPGGDVANKDEGIMIREAVGELRYVWAFLATLLDTPTSTIARLSKGFMGGGQYRKPFETKVITLKLPATADPRVLAAKTIVGIKRAGGPVRGHWRTYLRFGPHGERWCQRAHTADDWATTNDPDHHRCKHCHSFRTWIRPYEKPGLGKPIPAKDYVVTH